MKMRDGVGDNIEIRMLCMEGVKSTVEIVE
jgi:hypothetical protein